MSLKNEYHLRTVADAASKACFICYKRTPKVLITPDNKDFFYVCAGHLTDKTFCNPVLDPEAEAAKKKKAELDAEIAKVTAEYEEKMKKKKAKSKEKEEKAKDEDKKDSKTKTEKEDLEKEKEEKIKSLKAAQGSSSSTDEYRIFVLHRNFYQMRLDRLRSMQAAQKNRERMKDPDFFPTAPKGDL